MDSASTMLSLLVVSMCCFMGGSLAASAEILTELGCGLFGAGFNKLLCSYLVREARILV